MKSLCRIGPHRCANQHTAASSPWAAQRTGSGTFYILVGRMVAGLSMSYSPGGIADTGVVRSERWKPQVFFCAPRFHAEQAPNWLDSQRKSGETDEAGRRCQSAPAAVSQLTLLCLR